LTSRRKSDIENERLPPDLVDPEEAREYLSNPVTPIEETASPLEAIDENSALSGAGTSSPGSSGVPSPAYPSPASPTSPGSFRRGHGRQQSLGTTSTSPSTRRRSIENTLALLKDAIDDKAKESNKDIEALAESLSSPGGNRRRSDSTSNSLSGHGSTE
jgi:serine/threonine-protein phosphatase 2B catalytic subunit